MLKKSLLIALGALMAQGAFADVLSPEAALKRAEASGSSMRRVAGLNSKAELAYTQKTLKGTPAAYVFNKAGGGALILSASDAAIPVLGYTDSGNFDPSQMPPQMKFWLDEYAAQIEYAEENGAPVYRGEVSYDYPASWTYIAPLVQTKWSQGVPFSNDLPNSAYATGCVATAMAQVMNYHKYPDVGHGSITFTSFGQSLSMNFADKKFDWANMINDYSGSYTKEEASAVAYLMKACGYSTEMQYGASSGTQVENAGVALPTYFGYDGNIKAVQRYSYTASEWASMLYDQLKSGQPVIYSGHSLGGYAHAFVADGYDGNGYFHINWGWAGMCDGYYLLDVLTPTVQGTGGSATGGYSFSQGMLIDIKPSTGTPTFQPAAELTLLGNLRGRMSGNSLILELSDANPGNLVNCSMVSIKPTFGAKLENTETGSVNYLNMRYLLFDGQRFTGFDEAMGPGSYANTGMGFEYSFDTSLPDGRYKISPVWRDTSITNTWQAFITANGCHDYVYLTKKGNQYTFENLPADRLVMNSAQLLTPLYMRNPCQIRFTLTNPNDVELTQSIVPVLMYNGALIFEADSQLVSVGPNETATVTLTYTFEQKTSTNLPTTGNPKDYTLGAYDYNLLRFEDYYYSTGDFGESYYGDFGTVTMKRASNSAIRGRGVTINNADDAPSADNGYLYGISQFSNIETSVKVECTSGFVSTPLTAIVYEYDPVTSTMGNQVYEQNFDNLVFVESGEIVEAKSYIRMTDFDVSKAYQMQIYYVQQNTRQSLGYVRFAAASGVNDVLAEGSLEITFDGLTINASSENGLESAVVYDLGGKTVAMPSCRGLNSTSIDASSLAKGVYIVKATDSIGNSKTLKVRL